MPSQPWLSNFVPKVLNLSTLFDILISNQPHTYLANDKTINNTYSRFIPVHWWIYGTCKMKGRKKTSKLFLQNYQIPSFLVLSVNNSITAHFGGFLFCFFYRPQWRLMGGARLERWAWWGVLEEVMYRKHPLGSTKVSSKAGLVEPHLSKMSGSFQYLSVLYNKWLYQDIILNLYLHFSILS